jgi:AcrR family transcriptional regulator
VALFSQNGFRGTTTRELAAAVGVSEPVLYQHFATKKDLYTAIVDQMLEEATEKFEGARVELCEEATDEQFFTRLGEMVLAWYLDDPRYIRLLMFSSLEGHELAQIWYEKATSQFIDYVMGEVRKRMEAGRFRELHPFLGTEAFVGMVAHFGMISAVHKCAFESVKREDVVKTFVDVYLNGIRRK